MYKRIESTSVVGDDEKVLESLSEISGSRVTGQKLGCPWFHPFPARMPISIAEHLIENLTTSEAVVLDPMAGCGTTLVAAGHKGRSAKGLERDPLALLISRCSIRGFNPGAANDLRKRVRRRAERLIRSKEISTSSSLEELSDEERQFIKYWFPTKSQRDLFALAASIKRERKLADRDLAWVVFSGLIISKSNSASFAIDISRSRPRRRMDRSVMSPVASWDAKFRQMIRRLPFLDTRSTGDLLVEPGDARATKLPNNSVDFVLTSPPYCNAIDYLRSHKFSLVWMGYSLAALREMRRFIIGTERGLWTSDGLPSVLEKQLGETIEENRRRAILRRYLSDLRQVLEEIHRVVKPGGLAILFLGPRLISKSRNDTVEVISRLADPIGLRVVEGAFRQLNPQRRSLPLPPGKSPLSKRIRREAIVALRK